EDLEFLTASSFNEAATDEVIDGLMALTIADRFHEACDPSAGVRLAERDRTLFQQIEDELEMLKLFDGDRVELFDARVEVAVFFEVQCAGGGFAFEVGVIDQDGREVADDFGEPIGRDFFTK